MTIIIAIDSFKGSATSQQLNHAVANGIKSLLPETDIKSYPIADGGEGTLDAFYENGIGSQSFFNGEDCFGRETEICYLLDNDEQTAILEVAQTSGLHFTTDDVNPTEASSYSLGELIKHILDSHLNVKEMIIGLGGSAINDGGIGMMQALGVSFTRQDGKEIARGVNEIQEIVAISDVGLHPRLKEINVTLLSDVKNPLVGKNGATFIFGKQKGIKNLQETDDALRHYSHLLATKYGVTHQDYPGAGAAGGLGFSLLYFANTTYLSGATYLIEKSGLLETLTQADLVITGEGKMDEQSIYGKLPFIIANKAKNHQVPVIGVVGDRHDVTNQHYESGFDLILNLQQGPISLQGSILQTEDLAYKMGQDIARILLLKHL